MKKLLAVLLLFSLSNCAPAMFGGTAFGGKLLIQDKTVGESFSDTSIWTKIKSKMLHKKLDTIFSSITVTVNEGRVLLTGEVPSREAIIEVLKICWDTQGVKEVINELSVEGRNKKGLIPYTKDSWITTQARSKMLFSDIKSINFSVETINGIVYLFGIARSQSELEKTIDKLSSISGVEKVVSYVRVIRDIHDRVQSTRGKVPKQEYIDIDDIEDEESKSSNKKYGKVEIEEDEVFDKNYDS